MKKILLILVSAFLAFGFSNSANAEMPSDSQYSKSSIDLLPTVFGGQVGYMIYGALSVQSGLPAPFTSKGLCSQPDAACLNGATFINYSPAYFDMCEKTTLSPCIVALEGRKDSTSEWLAARFVKEIDYYPSPSAVAQFMASQDATNPNKPIASSASEGIGWKYQPDTRLPGSGTGPLVFNIPGLNHAGGSSDYVLDGRYEISSAVESGKAVNPKVGNITLSLRPTNIVANATKHSPVRATFSDGKGSVGLGGEPGGNTERSFLTEQEQGNAKQFASSEIEFRLSFELPKSTVGWFHGRLTDPNIQVSPASDGQNLVVVSGKPTQIPITSASMPYAEAEKLNSNLINSHWPQFIRDGITSGQRNGIDEWNTWGGFDTLFKAWLPHMGSKAKGTANLWMLNTLPADQVSNSCFKADSQLAGMITTNAMAYQAGPPTFTNGLLQYQVAGVHYDPSGAAYQGTYDLQVRADVGRCLYGFSSAPISASVSVIDSSDGMVTAVTSFNEKNGWMKFSASGFGFSQKQINVKLSQKKPTSITGWPASTKSVPALVQKSIKDFAKLNAKTTSYTCVGYFTKNSAKPTALARAKQACQILKSQKPTADYSVDSSLTSKSNLANVVAIYSN